jgi:hypothetical protein
MTEVRVVLACPECSHEWHAATIQPTTWWGKDASPEKIAKFNYCPRCQHPPPMNIVLTEEQPDLPFEVTK